MPERIESTMGLRRSLKKKKKKENSTKLLTFSPVCCCFSDAAVSPFNALY